MATFQVAFQQCVSPAISACTAAWLDVSFCGTILRRDNRLPAERTADGRPSMHNARIACRTDRAR